MKDNRPPITLHLVFIFGYAIGYCHAKVDVPWQLFLLVCTLVGALLFVPSLLRKKD